MKTQMLILLFFVLLQFSCEDGSKLDRQEAQFVVKNSTDFALLDVSVFSVPIDDLLPNSESNKYNFSFERLEDDPIITFKTKDATFVKYLLPDSTRQVNMIVIDSLNFETLNTYLHIEKRP